MLSKSLLYRAFTTHSQRAPSIVGLCNPLIDITMEVDSQNFLDKYQIRAGNAILADQPIHKQLISDVWGSYQSAQNSQGITVLPGGSGLNTIRAANFMLKSKYPQKCKFIGSVGKDSQAESLEKILENEGVVSLMSKAEGSTGQCAAIVYEKERSLVADLGAALKFPTEHVENVEQHIEEATILYATAFFLTSNTQALFKLLNKKPKSTQFALNLSATFLIDQYQKELHELIPQCDYLFGNEDEFAHLAKVMDLMKVDTNNEKDYFELCWKLKDKLKYPGHIVVTRGSKSVIVSNKDPKSYTVPKLEGKLIKDTNGAGDSFVGGFLSKIALGQNVESAVKGGMWCSRQVLQQVGCNFPDELPDPEGKLF
ncbi:hypothetical protein FGO68_gene11032 [Halteria grandinella]|uniref:Adenosine kinase n=1 Tax=Halteria grandinella TaxID=5974 RepID=A0A8J8NW40_HALGN|nr:hypothetical protein FGO68_gene11032 [Halteria grandinella]